MALLTSMTLQRAQRLGSAYGLNVTAIRPVPRGINSNFVWHLSDGRRVFVRVCEQRDRADVDWECRLLVALAAAGVPTPRPLASQGGDPVGTYHGKPMMVFPFCRGRSVCQAGVTVAHVERLGRAVARLHSVGAELGAAAPRVGQGAGLRARIDRLLRAGLTAELSADLRTLAVRLDQLEGSDELQPPATAVIHGDLFRDNVLWDGRELSALLDFEFAEWGDPVFDLMVTLLAWCFGAGLETPLARSLMAGYQSVRPLSETERRRCFGQAQRAALRFAVSRISDYELQPRQLVAYKDYRRFVARLSALDQLGEEGFVRRISAA